MRTNMSEEIAKKPRIAWGVFVPALAFFALVIVFAIMLTQEGRDTSALPSALIGRVAPTTPLPPVPGLIDANGLPLPGLEQGQFVGKISLVNVWASWCAPCRAEHPYLMDLSEDPRLQIVGLNHKDKSENAVQFLSTLGNPYDLVGADGNGRASIEWGVYGVPETFLVGPDAMIRYKHTGPLTPEIIERDLMPEVLKLAISKTKN